MGTAEKLIGMQDDIRADMGDDDVPVIVKNYLSGVLQTIQSLELGVARAEREANDREEWKIGRDEAGNPLPVEAEAPAQPVKEKASTKS